jgi:ubiquinone/menaquinone biosynthesis C-methylase UbiE
MSAETLPDYPPIDDKDSVLYMMLRRVINNTYAEQPVDFNKEGLIAGETVLGRAFGEHDVIVDIGSNSGEMIARAAITLGITPEIICIEPNQEAFVSYFLLDDEVRNRVSMIRGRGETLPLQDNSVEGASMHNVIFRAQDAMAVLQEVKRVVKPGGFVAISSNARGHAFHRYDFERNVAERVIAETGTAFTPPRPPAEGYYFEYLPKVIAKVGGLKKIDELDIFQQTSAIITRGERLQTYLDTIKYAAANTDTPPRLRSVWRRVVDEMVAPAVEDAMTAVENNDRRRGIEREPFFADTIRRGMSVFVNTKIDG